MDKFFKASDHCADYQEKQNDRMEYDRKIPIDVSLRESLEEAIRPTNGVSEHGPWEFKVQHIRDTAVPMDRIMLYVKAKVTVPKSALDSNSKIPTNAFLTPINYLHATMWKSIDVRLNDKPLDTSGSHHIAYKAIMQSLLSVDRNSTDYLLPSFFVPDTDNEIAIGSGDPDNDSLPCAKKRRQLLNLNSEFEMIGPLTGVDFLLSDSYLAPFNNLTFTLHKHDDDFIFNSADEPATNTTTAKEAIKAKLVITDICLYVRRMELSKTGLEGFKPDQLQRYLGTLSEVQMHALSDGITQKNLKIYTGRVLPKQLIIGMCETDAVLGDYKKYPFEFKHFDLNEISLKVNAVRHPQDPLKPDFTNKRYMREYQHLLSNLGKWRTNTGICVTPTLFANGLTLFAFDLTPDLCGSFHVHHGREGTLELELHWKKALTKAITVIVYTCCDNVVVIDPVKKEHTSEIF